MISTWVAILPLFLISAVHTAPKEAESRSHGLTKAKYSISEKRSTNRKENTLSMPMPLAVAESTLPHVPVLREMLNEPEQHDMSTSTPSSESLESQLQSPHVVRKKAFVDDFDTSGGVAGIKDLLQTMEWK